MFAIVLLILGLLVAVSAHFGALEAERRSKRTYDQLISTGQKITRADQWGDIRHIVGSWGCFYLALHLVRSLAVLVVIFSTGYLILLLFN